MAVRPYAAVAGEFPLKTARLAIGRWVVALARLRVADLVCANIAVVAARKELTFTEPTRVIGAEVAVVAHDAFAGVLAAHTV
jgi:hypothetical protein